MEFNGYWRPEINPGKGHNKNQTTILKASNIQTKTGSKSMIIEKGTSKNQ